MLALHVCQRRAACVFRVCGLSLSACRPTCVFRACGLCVLRIFSWQMQHARWRLQREPARRSFRARRAWPQPQHPLRTFSWRVGHSGHSPGASGTQDILLARRAWPQPQHPLRTFSGLSRNTRSQPQHPVCRRTQDILLAHRAWRRAVSFYSEHVGTQDGGFYGGFYSGHVGTQDGTLGLLIG